MPIGRPLFGLDVKKAPRAVVASLEPIIRFFSYHDAHPVALGMVLMEKFGHDWVDWEPDALKHEIITSFRATSVSDHNWQKIQAFRTCLLVTTPWAEWHIFENIVLAMNNVIPDPFVLQQCSVAQLMAGVDIINQVREEEFGTEIEGYVASCAIDEGLMWLPEPLDFAREALEEPMYRCKDCGNVGRWEGLVTKDKRCDACCERYRHGREFDGNPNPGLSDTCGKNIQRFEKRPPGDVPSRFEEWKNKDSAAVDVRDTLDVQAAKLVTASKYMLLRRKQLVEQLEELKSWVTH
jgi:hypothetical protein